MASERARTEAPGAADAIIADINSRLLHFTDIPVRGGELQHEDLKIPNAESLVSLIDYELERLKQHREPGELSDIEVNIFSDVVALEDVDLAVDGVGLLIICGITETIQHELDNELKERNDIAEHVFRAIQDKVNITNNIHTAIQPAKTYQEVSAHIDTFIQNTGRESIVPIIIFTGHGEETTGRLVFQNERKDIADAWNDIREKYVKLNATRPPHDMPQVPRITFSECWAHKLDEKRGKTAKPATLHSEGGSQYMYFTDAGKPTTTRWVRKDTTKLFNSSLQLLKDPQSVQFLIPLYDNYLTQQATAHEKDFLKNSVKSLIGDVKKVYGDMSDASAKDDYIHEMIREGDCRKMKWKIDDIGGMKDLEKNVFDIRRKLQSQLVLQCPPQSTNTQRYNETQRVARAYAFNALYTEEKVVSKLAGIYDDVRNHFEKGGLGHEKLYPAIIVNCYGFSSPNGIAKLHINGDKTTAKALFDAIYDIYRKNKHPNQGDDKLRVVVLCYGDNHSDQAIITNAYYTSADVEHDALGDPKNIDTMIEDVPRIVNNNNNNK